MKEKKIIIGNWKMAPKNIKEARTIFQKIRTVAGKLQKVQTVICPSYVFISELKKTVTGHRCVLGAQNVSFEKDEPHTGEVSVEMIRDVGAKYVIIGHSERRAKGETNYDVARKVDLVTKNGLIAVICVGESERDDDGKYTLFVKQQILDSLEKITQKNIENVIIAYEPIWAIGSAAKREATLEDVQEMSIFIRKILIDSFGVKRGSSVPILYGGSVNPSNASLYLENTDVNGFLIGRASLKPVMFEKILKSANI